MKWFILTLAVALWSSAAHGHSIGVFADPLGTDCNLVIPYPGGPVTVYVVGTIDETAVWGVIGGGFRIGGLPQGWTGSVSAYGPGVNIALGNPFAEDGVLFAYPNNVSGHRVFLVLSITPSSPVEGVGLVILPHADLYLPCGFEGYDCPEPCPFFCAFNGLGYNCHCAESLSTTINGLPCTVATTNSTWGGVKCVYK